MVAQNYWSVYIFVWYCRLLFRYFVAHNWEEVKGATLYLKDSCRGPGGVLAVFQINSCAYHLVSRPIRVKLEDSQHF